MLRVVVIALVVANLLLFGFEISKPEKKSDTPQTVVVADDPNIPTIHLFSELRDDTGLMDDNRRCFTLGPFHSSEDMEAFRGQVEAVAATISERRTQALVEKGYWVFMPPYGNLLEANQALLSLQALGLKDIGVIYEGERVNAISLGYFLRQGNARKRKRDLEARGYAPQMQVQRQAESRYWLDYEQSPGSELPTLDMQDRPSDFMQRATPCSGEEPPVATSIESQAGVAEGLQTEVELPGNMEKGRTVDKGLISGEISVPEKLAGALEEGQLDEPAVSDEAILNNEDVPAEITEVMAGSEDGVTDEGENEEGNQDKPDDDQGSNSIEPATDDG